MVWGILPVLGVPAAFKMEAIYHGVTTVVNKYKNANGVIVHVNRTSHASSLKQDTKNEEDSDRDAEAADPEEAESQTRDLDGDVKMEDDAIYDQMLERHALIRKDRYDAESLVCKPSSGLMLCTIA